MDDNKPLCYVMLVDRQPCRLAVTRQEPPASPSTICLGAESLTKYNMTRYHILAIVNPTKPLGTAQYLH